MGIFPSRKQKWNISPQIQSVLYKRNENKPIPKCIIVKCKNIKDKEIISKAIQGERQIMNKKNED